MLENIEKIFFVPGDLVQIKHSLTYKPRMLVKGKETRIMKDEDKNHFLGIKCFWFTTDGLYQEQVFNTKDLTKV